MSVDEEARRRVDAAARALESAMRLGADPVYARAAMDSAVRAGAEAHAEDAVEAWERRSC